MSHQLVLERMCFYQELIEHRFGPTVGHQASLQEEMWTGGISYCVHLCAASRFSPLQKDVCTLCHMQSFSRLLGTTYRLGLPVLWSPEVVYSQ